MGMYLTAPFVLWDEHNRLIDHLRIVVMDVRIEGKLREVYIDLSAMSVTEASGSNSNLLIHGLDWN
jgi:hypothetical protein